MGLEHVLDGLNIGFLPEFGGNGIPLHPSLCTGTLRFYWFRRCAKSGKSGRWLKLNRSCLYGESVMATVLNGTVASVTED